jgi:hypothetical protein
MKKIQPNYQAKDQLQSLLHTLETIRFQSDLSAMAINEINFQVKGDHETIAKGIEIAQTYDFSFLCDSNFEKELRATFKDFLLQIDDKEMLANSLLRAFNKQDNLNKCLDITGLEKMELFDNLQPSIILTIEIENLNARQADLFPLKKFYFLHSRITF